MRPPFASFIITGAVVLGLLTAGCSGGGSDTSGDRPASGPSQPPGPKAEVGMRRIIILNNGNSPFWDACRAGMLEAERELKLAQANLQAAFEDNNGKPDGQIEKLRQFASQSDIAAIGISATDANNAEIADQLRALKKKGVHIITIDSDVDREKFRDARFAFIGTDNLAGGKELGKCARYIRPTGGEYVTFVGRRGAQNAIERIGGFKEGTGDKFKELDKMEDLNDRFQARENVRNAIRNHPGLNVLVGIWSYNAPAIVDVVQDLDRRSQFTIVVFDAEPIAIQQMGEGMIDALVVQNPYRMGYDGIALMKALVEKDQAKIKELLPKQGQSEGDLIDTGLKVVVPDQGSPLKAEMFNKNTEFLTLSKFREWLAKYKLTGS